MPDDLGGSPFPEGDDHGHADDEFAPVVFDEEFVRSARIHEPTAQERMLAAAQARADEPGRAMVGIPDDESGHEDEFDEGYPFGRTRDDYDPEWDEDDDRYDPRSAERRPVHTRWHRTVAWVLAVVMGIGVVALTVAAVYRGASSGRQQPGPPPGSSRMEAPADTPSPVAATGSSRG